MKSESTQRILTHPILGEAPREQEVAFTFDGQEMFGYAGEPIAAALMARDIRILRRSERNGQPRGIYCGIGHCYECRVTVNGTPGMRACITPVQEGIRVESAPSPPGEEVGA